LVISPEARRPEEVKVSFKITVLFMYYVYIIENLQSGIFYKGSTSDYLRRLNEHNDNLNKYTKGKGPWKLVFVQQYETKTEALLKEKKLKRCNKEYLRWLINQPVDILNLK
jgi:putative endonuclease